MVTIKGENFIGPDFSINQLSYSKSLSNVTLISDTEIHAIMYCSGSSASLTVSYGSSSKTSSLKIISSSNCFTDADIGKIVLSDGSFVSKENFNSSTMTAIAVISGHKYNGGQAVAVGLQTGDDLQWAPSGTTGYNTNFTDIVCTPSETGSGVASSVTFTGDTDGGDNWEYICSVDTEGSQDAETNYPVFNFANTYGDFAGLTGTSYAYGWYIPSIKELCDIYRNKTTIEASLAILDGFKLLNFVSCSSSQCDSENYSSYGLNFEKGFVNYASKIYDYDVLVLRAFNAQ